jgi:hypothetical protein
MCQLKGGESRWERTRGIVEPRAYGFGLIA